MAAVKSRHAYVPAVPHKDGGFTCQHAGCKAAAVVSEALLCHDDCAQARAEVDIRLQAATWDHIRIPEADEREMIVHTLASQPAADDELALSPAEQERLRARLDELDGRHAELLATAKAEWRDALQRSTQDHDHQHYRCADHAADLGEHVAEGVANR